jgi:hypothetical protein
MNSKRTDRQKYHKRTYISNPPDEMILQDDTKKIDRLRRKYASNY